MASIPVVTPWALRAVAAMPEVDQESRDMHDSFVKQLDQLVTNDMPWLRLLLEASRANVIVHAGRIGYALPGHPAMIEIPELTARLEELQGTGERATVH